MQAYLMLLHRSDLPLPASFQDWQKKSRELQITDLEKLYQHSHDEILIALMVFIKIDWYQMLAELYKRFREKPVGLAILMDWQTAERLWIQKRRLKIDAEEVKQDGMVKGIELLNNAKIRSLEHEEHDRFLKLPQPNLPVEMDDLELGAWHALLEEMWNPSLRAAFVNVVPLLNGDMESSRGAVDNFLLILKNRRKDQQRRRILRGTEKFPKGGAESWRADWDLSKFASAGRSEAIEHETIAHVADPETYLVEIQSEQERKKYDHEMSRHGYEIAICRSGKKGAIFLDALQAGHTVTEAAKIACMSRRNATRIKEAIRESHQTKALKKRRDSV